MATLWMEQVEMCNLEGFLWPRFSKPEREIQETAFDRAAALSDRGVGTLTL